MTCRAALVLCIAVLARQAVTRRQIRAFHERSEPDAESFGGDSGDSDDSMDNSGGDDDDVVDSSSGFSFPTKSVDSAPETDLGGPIASLKQEVAKPVGTYVQDVSEQKGAGKGSRAHRGPLERGGAENGRAPGG